MIGDKFLSRLAVVLSSYLYIHVRVAMAELVLRQFLHRMFFHTIVLRDRVHLERHALLRLLRETLGYADLVPLILQTELIVCLQDHCAEHRLLLAAPQQTILGRGNFNSDVRVRDLGDCCSTPLIVEIFQAPLNEGLVCTIEFHR